MRSQRFSTLQLLSLGTVAVLFPALRLFPAQTAEEAGRAGWLCAFAALPLCLGYALFLKRLQALTREGELLPEALPRLLGKRLGKAALLLDRLGKRRAAGLTTPKQIRFLEGKGFRHVGTWQFDTASRLIDLIANNGWRVPSDINPDTFKEAIA